MVTNPQTATGPELRLDKVGKTFGLHRALADVSLAFASGQVAAVLGPNGAGKSTLLSLLSTLGQPTQGTITFGGERLFRGSPLRALIGYVGHEPGLYGDLSARQNLRLFASLYGLSDADRRVEEMLVRVGLEGSPREAAVRTFSRGMLQRLALARACELILLGRRISAEEACAYGLVTRVEPAGAGDAVQALLGKSAAVLRLAKQAMRAGSLEEGERAYVEKLLPLPDCAEGVRAFLEKRTPRWEP